MKSKSAWVNIRIDALNIDYAGYLFDSETCKQKKITWKIEQVIILS